jgi:hypothetical protein
MKRLLLIAVCLVAPLQDARSQVDVNPFQTYGHTFNDLLDALRTLRKKTNPMAFFWLDMPQYTTAPEFHPDGAGEAFFVFPVARIFPKATPAKELEEELVRLRRSARFAPTFDSKRRRLAYYPPEAVAELRLSLVPWLLTTDHPVWGHLPGFEFVVARIPRDHEAEFLDAFLHGFLHTNGKEFKCSVAWN